jgi:hypothetical protein
LFSPCTNRNIGQPANLSSSRHEVSVTARDTEPEEASMTRMTSIRSTIFSRTLVRVALGGIALTAFVADASATDARVRAACTGDYLAYCSQHDPDGAGVRQCMRANGSRLSAGCVNALIAAGEVPKQQMAKRQSTRTVDRD